MPGPENMRTVQCRRARQTLVNLKWYMRILRCTGVGVLGNSLHRHGVVVVL